MLTNIESENRYVLRAGGETVFVGAEVSTDCQRLCCGSARSFHLTLVDPTQQEAISYLRRLGCSSGLLGCLLQVGECFMIIELNLLQWSGPDLPYVLSVHLHRATNREYFLTLSHNNATEFSQAKLNILFFTPFSTVASKSRLVAAHHLDCCIVML